MRLELILYQELAPKASASANFTTLATITLLYIDI